MNTDNPDQEKPRPALKRKQRNIEAKSVESQQQTTLVSCQFGQPGVALLVSDLALM
jgi:hypothetical protein